MSEGTCAVDGVSHAPGERYDASDGCNYCICLEGGAAACTHQVCASQIPGGAGASGGSGGTGTGCNQNGVAYSDGATFLADDGCNACICERGVVRCSETNCKPECTRATPGRLCVIGTWRGDSEHVALAAGDALTVEVEPAGCISAWCNDMLIDTASATEPTPNRLVVDAAFCFAPNPRSSEPDFCIDCGSYGRAITTDVVLREGENTITVAGTTLSLTFTVPSVTPQESLCVGPAT